MDCDKTGKLIHKLRTEKGLTQAQLARQIQISDKAVSKWERGAGFPDVSLLGELSAILDVNLEDLLEGQLTTNDPIGGNMKKLKFYICPQCGNVITGNDEAAIACCGRKLEAQEAVKAEPEQKLDCELIDNEYCISSDHPMTKDDYIAFAALMTGDTLIMKKQYPEWNFQIRIPRIGHGKLVWYSRDEGLLYQLI
ncbi:MAG: helix-turn-helix domain-containing protein [Eubacteriaceae bacterium]|jgi:transcriptional regulator with XRE-family HTH domain